ncbi:hypothetical protein WJX73_004603 [Symbiochloris irregularis]|uniref:Uncharacterized protein n=1 Tax=Symbiochloris irregularis TaxID=706552 RepID=A0AAW1NRN0_9CHLO
MAPRLSAKSLICLACTCKWGRQLIESAGADCWQSIAAQTLPVQHPARRESKVSDIQAALAAYRTSQARLCRGQVKCEQHVYNVNSTPKFAPNGREFAVLKRLWEEGTGVEHSEASSDSGSSSGDLTDFWSLVVLYEDGTESELLRAPKNDSEEDYIDWQWSRDGRSLIFVSIPESDNYGEAAPP